MRLRLRCYWGLGGLLLLTGCGDDRPRAEIIPPHPAYHASQPAPAKLTLPDVPTPASPDPMVGDAGDPLLGGSTPGHAASDPLLMSDPFKGPVMPTQHSHWLRGHLRSAHVTVLLNSARQGVYYGTVDTDITMRLRKGVNTVTFVYQPGGASSSAQMEIVESEHHPPIPPLVTFQSLPTPENGKLTPTTQTFSFVAN